jgi:phage recombination protein Bet
MQIQKYNSGEIGFSEEQVSVIKKTIAPEGITDTELSLFIQQCKRTQLDPFSRQIYATKIQGKISIQATIDGFRLIAERSGDYQGQTLPLYLNKTGKWSEVWTETGYPVACKVGVYKKGFIEPLFAIAKWDSYVQKVKDGKVGFMWAKMPEVMLAKVAEALALRKAFPNDLSGIYSQEEMEQAQVVDISPAKEETPKTPIKIKTMEEMSFEELIEAGHNKVVTLLKGANDQKTAISLLKYAQKVEASKLYSQEEKNRVYQDFRVRILKLIPDLPAYLSLINDGEIFSLPTEGICEELYKIVTEKYGNSNGEDNQNSGEAPADL